MEQSTSLASKLGDIGLIGIAVFVATALVAATLGGPALSPQPAASDEPPASADDGPEESAAPQAAAPEAAGDGQSHEAGHGHGDETHEHDDGPQVTTPAAGPAGHAHDEPEHDPTLRAADEPAQAAGHHDGSDGEHDAQPGDSSGHDQTAGHESHGEHADQGDDEAGQAAGHEGQGEGDAGHEEHGEDGEDGHEGHDEDGEGHNHSAMRDGCAEEHPETVRLQSEVAYALEHLYPDPATLIAQGYIPYFDAQIPGALATEGMGHWLNPDYIDNGVELDPTRPESILTDEWNRPIGVMFIENADDQAPTPVYVNDDDGTECSPWHPHTDMPARFSWWYYRQVHDGAAYNEGEVAPAEVTPAMMHVWAIDHHESVYAHGPPAAEHREGFPPPRPGYPTPATPLDGQIPDPEDPDSYPTSPQDTCPHCPEGNNDDNPTSDDDPEGREEDDEDVVSGVVGDLSS